MPAPSPSPKILARAFVPTSMALFDDRHGLIAGHIEEEAGSLLGCPPGCRGLIGVTRDGGQSWKVSYKGPRAIADVTTFGDRLAWATIADCDGVPRQCTRRRHPSQRGRRPDLEGDRQCRGLQPEFRLAPRWLGHQGLTRRGPPEAGGLIRRWGNLARHLRSLPEERGPSERPIRHPETRVGSVRWRVGRGPAGQSGPRDHRRRGDLADGLGGPSRTKVTARSRRPRRLRVRARHLLPSRWTRVAVDGTGILIFHRRRRSLLETHGRYHGSRCQGARRRLVHVGLERVRCSGIQSVAATRSCSRATVA